VSKEGFELARVGLGYGYSGYDLRDTDAPEWYGESSAVWVRDSDSIRDRDKVRVTSMVLVTARVRFRDVTRHMHQTHFTRTRQLGLWLQ